MSISLTEPAAERIRGFLANGGGQGLRFGVRKTGCSGFAYVVDIADRANVNDHIFQSRGIDVFVDPKSLTLVDGKTIHFQKEDLFETFVFQNPNVSAECGCGESFTVD